MACSTDLHSVFHSLRKFCFNLPLKVHRLVFAIIVLSHSFSLYLILCLAVHLPTRNQHSSQCFQMDSAICTKAWCTGTQVVPPSSTATPCPMPSLSKSGHMKLHTVPELTCFLTAHSKTVCPQLFCGPIPILPSGRPQLVLPPHSLSKLNRRAGYPTLLPQHPGGPLF